MFKKKNNKNLYLTYQKQLWMLTPGEKRPSEKSIIIKLKIFFYLYFSTTHNKCQIMFLLSF